MGDPWGFASREEGGGEGGLMLKCDSANDYLYCIVCNLHFIMHCNLLGFTPLSLRASALSFLNFF